VTANVRDHGVFEAKTGAVRPAVELEGRLRREAADYLDALGCTPRSRARLGLDVARGFDLAQHWADQESASPATGNDPGGQRSGDGGDQGPGFVVGDEVLNGRAVALDAGDPATLRRGDREDDDRESHVGRQGDGGEDDHAAHGGQDG